MKQLITLISIMLMLVSCGTEENKTKQDPTYDYVEMEECTIPVLKEFNITQILNKGGSGRYNYELNVSSLGKVALVKLFSDIKIYKSDSNTYGYIDAKEMLLQNKNLEIISEIKSKNFKIIKFNMINSIFDTSSFYLFIHNIQINILALPKEKQNYVNYLLDYCKKTWKQNKGETNASTSK